MRRHDADRAQHVHREQAPRRVEQARAEHHVSDNLVTFFRDERKSFASLYGVAQRVDEVWNNWHVMFSERREMYRPDGPPIAVRFRAHLHSREPSGGKGRRAVFSGYTFAHTGAALCPDAAGFGRSLTRMVAGEVTGKESECRDR